MIYANLHNVAGLKIILIYYYEKQKIGIVVEKLSYNTGNFKTSIERRERNKLSECI